MCCHQHYSTSYIKNPPASPAGISLTSYADGCTLMATSNYLNDITDKLNFYFAIVKTMRLSFENSLALLFTSWTNVIRTTGIDDAVIPTIQKSIRCDLHLQTVG